MLRVIDDSIAAADSFREAAHLILAKHESGRSRLVTLDQTRRKLAGLSIPQDALFRESLKCLQSGAHRAAHVMAWAAFADCLEQKLASDGLVKLFAARPAWSRHGNIDELRESYPEYQFIDAARDVGLIGKTEAKALHGLLSKRNECAHPGHYSPGLNEALGYFSELLNRVQSLLGKTL